MVKEILVKKMSVKKETWSKIFRLRKLGAKKLWPKIILNQEKLVLIIVDPKEIGPKAAG